MKRQPVHQQLPAVTARAAVLAKDKHVQYSIVLSYQDGLDLLAGKVPDAVRPQILRLVKRDPRTESTEEYALRVSEATA